MRHLPGGTLAVIAVLSLGGCERHKAAESSGPPPSKLAADAADVGMLAAAEPFETLAQIAFTARLPFLDRNITTAISLAAHAKPALPPDAQRQLKTHLDAIAAARLVEDRPGIALAALEVYRLFVSHAPPAMVPREVYLLRYAGLRYGADLKAQRDTWRDMAEAAAFGERAWNAIRGVADPTLRDGMSKALADMAAAAQRRDAVRAAAADQRELELVGLLETYFATPRR
jgi:hypothetical protein